MTDTAHPPRTPAENAELALLLEVSGTPKPGNVDREREYPDLRFEQFLAGAVGTRDGFRHAASGEPVGRAFERAVAGMSRQRGGNTQFGAVLLLTPLIGATAHDTGNADGGNQRARSVTPQRAQTVVDATTVDDTVAFYTAFEHVDVAVDDPPEELEALDVRHGGAAEPAIRERGLSLGELMEKSASVDGIAAEWTDGFPRTFEVADHLLDGDGPITDRASEAFLSQLAASVDTFVITQHDQSTATEVKNRAQEVLAGRETARELAADFVDRGINPGTTADIVAGGLFVALDRGLEV